MQLFTPVAQISQQSDYWIDLQRGNWDRLQRLLPLKRAHTEVEHDVQVHPCCHGSGTFFHWIQILVSFFRSWGIWESFSEQWWWVQVFSSYNLMLGTVSWEWLYGLRLITHPTESKVSTLAREIAFQICNAISSGWADEVLQM